MPPLILAPMADLTHAPFRQLVAEIGGCSLFYSEMLNSRIVSSQSLERDPCCQRSLIDYPLIAQLLGNDPELIKRAVIRLEKMGFDGFDINMGCARQSISRHGWGLALMEDVPTACNVVRAARKATGRPVFVKLRSGINHDKAKLLSFAERMKDCGADALTLHPRSKQDGFKRPAAWHEIAHLVEHLSVPIIGNGDVQCFEDARKMIGLTKCAGIMIGRAALIRPWIFWELVNGAPWRGSPLEVLERMAALTVSLSPPELQVKRFMLFCSWFLRNWSFHHHFMRMIRHKDSVPSIARTLLRELRDSEYTLLKKPFCSKL